jgi:hypothetical protein
MILLPSRHANLNLNLFIAMPTFFSPDHSKPSASRRTFLKTTALLSLGAIGGFPSLAAVLEGKGSIALVVAPDDALANAVPPQWALGELTDSLTAQGAVVRTVKRLADSKPEEFCVVAAAMHSPVAKKMFAAKKITAPTEAEALVLVQSEIEGRVALLAAGTDERGLVYALTELADRVACLQTSRAALEFSEPLIERPSSRTRSVMRGFNSEVEDKTWFYDRDYWRAYLTMLVYSRLNRMSFTTGMGYNSVQNVTDGYLLFPYPFFVTVPGHDVRAQGLPDEERARNLEMLKFIGEECARRGLRFQFGIWTLAYVWERSPKATYQIKGLTDATHAAYCRDALTLLLKEVPTISGVTFRVHSESGIPKGQENFWQTQFNAIQECGRRVEIDMHLKNMTPETLQIALNTGQPVVLGPKYCGEHLGLPYQQSAIREREMTPANKLTDPGTGVLVGDRGFTRYGYADALAENRTWDVVFRIWPGTQRFLLNGDPATFAGYGRCASFCGATGIELSEPLHFKGRRGSGQPGGRLAYADASLETKYDFEKYRYTYRLWGRLGYNPDTNPEVWRRWLRQEFGTAALAVEQALAPASRILTLFTLAHAPSADCVRYWPEIYTSIPITDATRKVPSYDMFPPILFGNVTAFDPQLFHSPDESAEALLSGKATGKYSSLEAAQWLEDLATAAGSNLDQARNQLGTAAAKPGFRRVEEDVLIQRGLALFFAGKLRSAVYWRIYVLTGHSAAGEAAIASYLAGRDAWAAMAERAKKIYRADISYGGSHTSGHWADRLPDFDADIADLKKNFAAGVKSPAKYDAAAAERALKLASAKPARLTVTVKHTAPGKSPPGKALVISVNVASPVPHRVTLHYRHVNQAERWQSVELKSNGSTFAGEIPGDYTAKRWPLQYYFEIETGPAEATLFPPLAADLANVPYFVVRRTT